MSNVQTQYIPKAVVNQPDALQFHCVKSLSHFSGCGVGRVRDSTRHTFPAYTPLPAACHTRTAVASWTSLVPRSGLELVLRPSPRSIGDRAYSPPRSPFLAPSPRSGSLPLRGIGLRITTRDYSNRTLCRAILEKLLQYAPTWPILRGSAYKRGAEWGVKRGSGREVEGGRAEGALHPRAQLGRPAAATCRRHTVASAAFLRARRSPCTATALLHPSHVPSAGARAALLGRSTAVLGQAPR